MTQELPILVAEIGINAGGDVDIAKKTIDMVYDAVQPYYPLDKVFIKFQKRNPDLAVPPEMWDTPRKSLKTGQWTNYITYKREIEFGVDEYLELDRYIKGIYNSSWFVSVWDLDSVKWVKENFPDMPYVKIPSAHLTNVDLIDAVMETGIPPILSTGMSTKEEIYIAIRHAAGHNTAVPIVMHCNSSYPCVDNELDLNAIQQLYWMIRNEFHTDAGVGFSSHSSSPYPPIYSNFFNVSMIEFHVTLDRAMEGSDHSASLERNAIELLARETSRIPVIRGKNELVVYASELSKRKSLRGY